MDYTVVCRDMVRNDDPERYLVSLFAPATSQPHLWSLLAFNQEIAKIRENTSEPMLGEIRLQWWGDVLDEIESGSVREHPTVEGLASLLDAKPHMIKSLRDILESRRQDILGEGMVSDEAILSYASTVGGILQKAISSAWMTNEPTDELCKASQSIGTAWSLVGLVRAVPYQWHHGDLQLQTTRIQQVLNADEAWERLKPTLTNMLSCAESELNSQTRSFGKLVKAEKSVLLFATLLRLQLIRLKRHDNNPFKIPQDNALGFGVMVKLFWAQLTGNY